MRLIALCMVAAALSVALPSQAPAVVFTPGSYEMDWSIPAAIGQAAYRGEVAVLQKLSTQDAAKFQGLASTGALWGKAGRYLVVIDESQGAGKGHDIAYLVVRSASELAKSAVDPNEWPPRVDAKPTETYIDLRSATAVPLVNFKGIISTDSLKDTLIDCAFGSADSPVTKQAALDIMVWLAPAKPSPKPAGAYSLAAVLRGRPGAVIRLRGEWTGNIATDFGPAAVALWDRNQNGVYNDPGTDLIVLEYTQLDETGQPDTGSERLYVGKATQIGTEYMTFEPSPAGDRLDVQPYSGSFGSLKIDGRDCKGKPMKCESVWVRGESGQFDFELQPASGYRMPTGEYSRLMVELAGSPAAAGKPSYSLTIDKKGPVRIAADATNAIKIGGPLKMHINSDEKTVNTKVGGEVDLSITFTAGADSATPSLGGRAVAVTIKNSAGKTVNTGKAEFG